MINFELQKANNENSENSTELIESIDEKDNLLNKKIKRETKTKTEANEGKIKLQEELSSSLIINKIFEKDKAINPKVE
jgi:hypothetical protein